jgi:hypothetical protein
MSEDDIEAVLDKGILLFRYLQARGQGACACAWWWRSSARLHRDA